MTTSSASDLPARIVYGSSQARAEWLFRALYGLPTSRALEIAQFALTRYLPIVSARGAFETNVWAADEPAAFTAWATKDLVNMRRTIYDNVAVMAVGEREWLAVVGQLASHPAPDDQLEAALERWRGRDHMLL